MKVVKLENKKLTEEELRSNQNLHKPEDVHIHADVPYGVARDEDTAAQEHAEEVFDELEKNAEGITPKDPDDGGVKIEKNAYSEPIALDESLFTEDADDDNEIAKFLKDSVEWLIEQDEGCSTYKLDDRLGICVGWQDGYDPEDELAIHSATSPQYAIVAGIKVYTSDDMRTDYDWINYPYFANGEVMDDSVTIEPTENYDKLARYFSKEFDAMKDWEIEEDGLVIKSDDGEEEVEEALTEASDTVSLDDMISSYNGSVNDIASDTMLIDRSGDTYKVSLNDVRKLNGVYPEDGNDALLNKKIKFINDYVTLYNSDDNLFVEISSDVMPTDTQLNKLFDCIDEFMKQHRGVSKVYVDWRFTAGGGTNLTAGRSPKVLRDKVTAAIKSHNFKGVNESKELTEKKGKVEGEDDTVYQLVYDALFLGNKNFRPHIADEAGSVYDWEQSLIMLPGYNDYDLGIALEKEEDGKYAKAVADKLGLKYEIKPTSSLSDGYKFIATVRIPDEIANKDATEYVTSIGLDMDTIRPKRKGKK